MQTNSVPRSPLAAYLLFVLLLSSVGCSQSTTSKLSGRWEGRPDTTVERIKREAQKYGDETALAMSAAAGDAADDTVTSSSGSTEKTSPAEMNKPERATDWEAYDATIQFNFVSDEQLEMSFNGEQTLTAKWKIIATSPTGCTIEVRTESEVEAEAMSGAKSQAKVVLRRFEILLDERDEKCVGFTLSEVGADQQLGTLYFLRPKSAAPKSATSLE